MSLTATLSERVHETSRRARTIGRDVLTRRPWAYSGPIDLPSPAGRAGRNRRLALLLPGPGATGLAVVAARGYGEEDLSAVHFAKDGPVSRHFSAHPYPAHCSQLETTPWFGLMKEDERQSLAKLSGATIVPLIDRGFLAGLMAFDAAQASRPVGGPVLFPRAPGPTPAERVGWDLGTALARFSVPRSSTIFPRRETALGQGNLTRVFHETVHDLNNAFAALIAHSKLIETSTAPGVASTVSDLALRGAGSVRRLREILFQSEDGPLELVDVNDLVRSALEAVEPGWRLGRMTEFRSNGPIPDPVRVGTHSTCESGESYHPLLVTLWPAGKTWGNRSDLHTALKTFLAAALCAKPDQGGRLEVTSYRCDGWAWIRVRIARPGAPSENAVRAAETNSAQAQHLTSFAPPGHCRRVVAEQEGRMLATNSGKAGTEYAVLLPLASDLESTDVLIRSPDGPLRPGFPKNATAPA